MYAALFKIKILEVMSLAIAVLTGLPIGIAVLGVAGLFLGMMTGQIKFCA
jgi:hypothetical protein